MSKQYEGKLKDLGESEPWIPRSIQTHLTVEDTGVVLIHEIYDWLAKNAGKKVRVTTTEESFIIEVLGVRR